MKINRWVMMEKDGAILLTIKIEKRYMLEFIKNALDLLKGNRYFIIRFELEKDGDKKN
jgi:hypothetical protein